MWRDPAYLLDITRAAASIIEFVREMDQGDFLGDPKTQSAVLHQLAIIGEVAKRLSPELRQKHNSIPWAAIAGMRNRIIHEYGQVNLLEVWLTATRDIPALLAQLEPLMPQPE